MDKLVAGLFYLGLGVIAVSLTWWFEADHSSTPSQPESSEVKSNSIKLDESDFEGENPNIQEAIDQLTKPVPKPGTDQTGEQLQPATKQ